MFRRILATWFIPIITASSITATTLTVNGPTRLNGHLQVNGMAASGTDAVTIKADGQHNGLLVVDPNNAPIFGVGSYGGASVFGDSFRVHGTDIFSADLTLWADGSLTIDQRAGGPTLYGGSADPNVTPPATIHGLRSGDRYFRSWPALTYVWDGTSWRVQ